jgi:NAD(P)H-dependent FMN reductase
MPERPRLLIVWHSQTGACEQASACIARAASPIDVLRLHADQADAATVLTSAAIVIVAAENLAALSGRIKDFFDRSYYPLLGRTQGLPFASVICAGSDGENAQRQLDRIAQGLRWRRVAAPLRLTVQAQTSEAIQARKRLSAEQKRQCAELGAGLAEGLKLGIF